MAVAVAAITAATALEGPVDVSAGALVEAFAGGAYELGRVQRIAAALIKYSAAFGFRASIVAGQIAHETGWLKFGGDVRPEQLNLAGLGATGGGARGASFADEDTAVAAVFAHHAVYHWGATSGWPAGLQAYARLDPRHDAVISAGKGGTVQVLGDYRGTWAVPGVDYPERVAAAATVLWEASMGYPISRLVDLRGELATNAQGGPAQRVALAEKRGVVVHYHGPVVTAGDRELLAADARYHVGKDWSSDGSGLRGDGLMYHVAVGRDGTRYLCRDLEAVLWHCGAWPENGTALAVLVIVGGEDHATAEQLASLRGLCDEWLAATPAGHGTRAEVRGHQELSSTSCPGTVQGDFVLPYREGSVPAMADGHWFGETGHYVGGGFWRYWQGNGGVMVFGYPLSEEVEEEGRTVQYFERAVFEWWPENRPPYDVLPRRLGAEALERKLAAPSGTAGGDAANTAG